MQYTTAHVSRSMQHKQQLIHHVNRSILLMHHVSCGPYVLCIHGAHQQCSVHCMHAVHNSTCKQEHAAGAAAAHPSCKQEQQPQLLMHQCCVHCKHAAHNSTCKYDSIIRCYLLLHTWWVHYVPPHLYVYLRRTCRTSSTPMNTTPLYYTAPLCLSTMHGVCTACMRLLSQSD